MTEQQKRKEARKILLWQQIGCIIVVLAEKMDIPYKKALDMFYSSKTCESLHDEATGLYLMSNRFVAEEVAREFRNASEK